MNKKGIQTPTLQELIAYLQERKTAGMSGNSATIQEKGQPNDLCDCRPFKNGKRA